MTATATTARRILSHDVRPGMQIRSGATGWEYRVLWITNGWATLHRLTGADEGKQSEYHLADMGGAGIELITEGS